MINFDGIQVNTEVLMYSTFQVNRSGYRILFYTTSEKISSRNCCFLDGEDFSADGNYEVTLMTKATVYYDGRVIWEVREREGGGFHGIILVLLATSNL